MRQTMIALPAILAPVILIGGMMAGVLGSTEAAGITVVYAILIGLFVYRKLDWTNFIEFARETVLACASILLIVGVSELFAWVLAIDQIPTLAAQFLIGLSSNPYVLLMIANVILLAAGTILEPLPAILLLTPIIAPGLHPGRRRSDPSRHRRGAQPDDRPADAAGRHEPLHGEQYRPHSARARDGRRGAVHRLADHRAGDRHIRPGIFDLAAEPGHEMTQTRRSSR